MANRNLSAAKKAKNDEFYTQYPDIQKEIEAYLEYDKDTFRGKVVYCNCDDPFESNFFKYFVLNFKRLGLKRLITTSYKPSPVANTQLGLFGDDKTVAPVKGRPKVTANVISLYDVADFDGDGSFTLEDIKQMLQANKNNEWYPLEGDGDFRSDECVELLKQSDVVVTNPPFSLFREYVAQLVEYGKKFLIIGNQNAITYRAIFSLIKEDRLWLGLTMNGSNRWFVVPDDYPFNENAAGSKIENGKKMLFVNSVVWYTNLDHGRRHRPLNLMSMADNRKYNKKVVKSKTAYRKYDNYNAIEVPYADAIPSDYEGAMGVPISFLHKHSPDQFTIIGLGISSSGIEVGVQPYKPEHKKYRKEIQKRGAVDGDLYMIVDGVVTVPYARILIEHRKATA